MRKPEDINVTYSQFSNFIFNTHRCVAQVLQNRPAELPFVSGLIGSNLLAVTSTMQNSSSHKSENLVREFRTQLVVLVEKDISRLPRWITFRSIVDGKPVSALGVP